MKNQIRARIPRTSWGGDKNLAETLKEQDFRLILGDPAALESVRAMPSFPALSREKADGCCWGSV